MQTTAMIVIWTFFAIGCPGQVREFPLSNISVTTTVKVARENRSNFWNGPDKSNPRLAATTSLSKEVVHSIYHVNPAFGSIFTSSEMRKSQWSRKALKAKRVPGQCRHECCHSSLRDKAFCQMTLSALRKIGKLFERESQRRTTSKPSVQPKQKNLENVSAVSANVHRARKNKTLWRHSHQHSAQGAKCRSSHLSAKNDLWWN